jgi:ectoine hydroxylase-related dioxygenase (phytanoyl-CoA dioxygenase family)
VLKETYGRDGYVIARGLMPVAEIDRLLRRFVALTNELSGASFKDAHSTDIADRFADDDALQSSAYDAIRKPSWLVDMSKSPAVVGAARDIVGREIGLFSKIPFRIDVPLETKELAVWHQDYFYVKGNVDVVTAWIPMQDTSYVNGCLSVMPGSHKLGPVEHDVTVLGKRHFPSAHLNREIRLAEMKKGDVLFFDSRLLHTGNINLSSSVRYSVQARYTPIDAPADPGMGEVIPL